MAAITLEGLEDVINSVEGLIDIDKLKQAISDACLLVERSAKQNAPKGNGELRRSITHKVDVVGSEVVGTVYTPLLYAPYVEYGTGLFAEEGGRQDVPWHYKDDKGEWHSTSGMQPHPYMRPALNDNREVIKQKIKEAIQAND
jgi:HK97 gp10 family phage protein